MGKIVSNGIDYSGGGGGGGSSVSWNQIYTGGEKIAEITINGTTQNVYAPSGGGGGRRFESISITQANTPKIRETITVTTV